MLNIGPIDHQGSFVERILARRMRVIAYVAAVCVMGYFMARHWNAVAGAVSRHGLTVLYATCISASAITVQALNFLTLLDSPVKPPLAKSVHIWALANLTNYLGPFHPGLAVRMGYFKQQGVPIAATTAATFRQIHLSIWTATGLCTVGFLSNAGAVRILAAAGLTTFVGWPVLLAALRRVSAAGLARSSLSPARQAALAALLATTAPTKLGLFVAQYVLVALSLLVVYRAFGAHLAPHEALLLAIASAVSTLVSITPNNLGVQEALYGYVGHLGGLSVSDTISMVLIFRLAHVTACACLLALTAGLSARRRPAVEPAHAGAESVSQKNDSTVDRRPGCGKSS